jgi:hypothetical protein
MGQGRHIRPLFRCILLIVSTIQGITPDARDLASPLAISVVGRSLIDQHAVPDDGDSPQDSCQAVRECPPWRARQQVLEPLTGCPTTSGRAAVHSSRLIGTRSSTFGESSLVQGLLPRLCRLVC